MHLEPLFIRLGLTVVRGEAHGAVANCGDDSVAYLACDGSSAHNIVDARVGCGCVELAIEIKVWMVFLISIDIASLIVIV